MKRRDVSEKELNKVLWDTYGEDAWTLFYEVSPEKRHRIISHFFREFSNYELITGRGLVECKKDDPDMFLSYKDHTHHTSLRSILRDINNVNEKSLDPKGRRLRSISKRKYESYLLKQGRDLMKGDDSRAMKWKFHARTSHEKWYELQRKKRKFQKNQEIDR